MNIKKEIDYIMNRAKKEDSRIVHPIKRYHPLVNTRNPDQTQ